MRPETDLPLETRWVIARGAACGIVVGDEDVEGGQVGGTWRSAGQLVGAVGDEGHRVEQALEGPWDRWDPAPAGGGRGRVCHDSSSIWRWNRSMA